MRKLFGQFISVSLIALPSLLPAYTVTTWTDTGGGAGDMTEGGNWSNGVPNATTISLFDSTIPGINNNPTIPSSVATSNFSTPAFDFVNSASFFTFDINEPYALVFTGPGITGTNTDTTITAENSSAILITPYQISFSNANGIPVTTGNATIIANNDNGSINSNSVNTNDVAQILFDGSPGFSVSTNTSTVSVEGSLQANNTNGSSITNSHHVNDVGQIVFDGSGTSVVFSGASGSSNVTIQSGAVLQAISESASIIRNLSGVSNDLGQIIFDGSAGYNTQGGGVGHSFVTIESATIEATNNERIENKGSSTGNDFAQIIFDGSGGSASLNGQGNSTVNMNGSILTATCEGSLSRIINEAVANDLAQILFDGSTGIGGTGINIGHSSVTINETTRFDSILQNSTSITNTNTANDLAQILFDGSGGTGNGSGGVGNSNVTLNQGTFNAVVQSTSSIFNNAANANDLAQILFDGSGGLSNISPGIGHSTVTIIGEVELSATIEGTNSILNDSNNANDLAQILFDGSGGTSIGAGGTGHSVVTIGGLAGFHAALSGNTAINNPSGNVNDLGQIVFDGSGGLSSGAGGVGISTVVIGDSASFNAICDNGGNIESTNQANDLGQIIFDGSGGVGGVDGTGHSTVTINGATSFDATLDHISTIVNGAAANDLGQIIFDGSGGYGLGNNSTGQSIVTISGTPVFTATLDHGSGIANSNNANDVGQIVFDGSPGWGGLEGHSTVTIGGAAIFNALSANGSTFTNTDNTNDLGQIIFDGSGGFGNGGSGYSAVTIGETASFNATLESTSIISNTLGSVNDLGQIIFDGSGGLGSGQASFGQSVVAIGGSASFNATVSSGTISNMSNTNDLGQIIFNGSGGFGGSIGLSTVTIGDRTNFVIVNDGSISSSGSCNDIGQIIFDGGGAFCATGRGTGDSTVTIEGMSHFQVSNNSIISSTSLNANDLAQVLFDGSGGFSNSFVGTGRSVVSISDNTIFDISNLGSINASASFVNDIAQVLFDGSGGFSNSSSGAGHSTVTIGGTAAFNLTLDNASTITGSANTNDLAQIIFDGSGGFSNSFGGIGHSAVTIDGTASFNAFVAAGSSISNLDNANDVAQVLFDGSGGLSSSAAGQGNSIVSIGGMTMITAGNSGTLSSMFGNDVAQVLFDGSGGTSLTAAGQGSLTISLSGNSVVTASNSGTITNQSTLNNLGQIVFDGSMGRAATGSPIGIIAVSLSNDVEISAKNSGILSSTGSLSGLAQILFDGRGGSSTLTVTGTPLIAAVNSGTVHGDQIAFYDTTIIGSPTLKASNQAGTLVGGHGISFYGSTTATTPNIILEDSSLWIAAGVPSFFSIASLTGDLPSTVPLNQTLNIFTQSGATTEFDGVISDFSGTNDVVISGTGTQVFGGPNTYGGTTTINGGNLVLTSTGIIPHDAIVNSTGILSGSGIVGGNVFANYGATVSPGIGTSLGTLSVDQNYTQSAGATLLINISGALINGVPQSSQLDVVGTATLAGTLEVISTNGTYSIGRPYTILTAGTAIVGSFDQQVFTISPYLVVDVTYIRDPSVQILLSTDFVAGAQTANQAHVALQFDSTAVPTGDEEVVINDLLALPAAEVPSALDAMSGEQYAYLVQVNQYSDYRFGRRIFDAVRDSLDPCACEASCGSVHAWAVTEVGYGRTTGDSEAHGFNEFDVVTSGGIHRTCSPCTLFGIAYNAEGARLDFGLGSHNTMYNVQGSFYGMYTSPEFYVFSDLIVGQGYTHFKRHIDFGDLHRTAHCTPRFSHGVIYAECGCDLPVCEVLMQPFVGADLGYTYAQSFVERGADSLNLHVKERSLWTPNLYLGAHFTSLVRCIECNADLIYQHRFGSLGTTLHSRFDFGDTFTVSGRELSRNGFIGNINFSTHANKCVDFYLELSGELWDHQYWCAGSIGVKRVW